nr:unnamed protein product [Callosobruchus chinensis]
MVIELCRVKFWRKVFSVVKYCTSKALYSPRGEAHVSVISVSEIGTVLYWAVVGVEISSSDIVWTEMLYALPVEEKHLAIKRQPRPNA